MELAEDRVHGNTVDLVNSLDGLACRLLKVVK
jgi:hypothetical protein